MNPSRRHNGAVGRVAQRPTDRCDFLSHLSRERKDLAERMILKRLK